MSNPTKQELIDSLHSEWERTATFFQALPLEAWDVAIYDEPQQWTPRHILVHLCDAETQFRRMLDNSLQGGEGSPPNLDYDAYNQDSVPRLMERWATQSNAALIERLAGIRLKLIQSVEQFPPEDMGKTIRHPMLQVIQLHEFIRAVILHAKIHGRDIKRRLTA